MLGVECVTGFQNKIGRPRRAQAPDGKRSNQPSNKRASSTVNAACAAPAVAKQNSLRSPEPSREASPFPEGGTALGWMGIVPTADATEAGLDTPQDNPFITATAWPAMTFDYREPRSLPWDVMNDLDPMLTDPSSSLGSLPSYALDSPTKFFSAPEHSYAAAVEMLAPSIQSSTPRDVDVASDGLAKLSKLNIELHVRMAAVETTKPILNLDSFLYQTGALYIDNVTLAEFMLRASQEFLQILTRLHDSRSTPGHGRALQMAHTTFLSPSSNSPALLHESDCLTPAPSSCSSSDGAEPPLSSPIALTITSVFTQLIALYELILQHLTARIERIAIDPISPIPNLSSGGLPVAEPCIQGMLFADVVVHLLERIERILGIRGARADGDGNLLSARQRDVLWGELSGSLSVLGSYGATRPATVRSTFKKVAGMLRQISINGRDW